MALQYLFATGTGAPTNELDANFQTVGLLGVLPCSATGTNALTLTLLNATNTPTVSAYANNLMFSFVAGAVNTGAVTAQVGSLASLNVYKMGPTGPAALVSGDIQAGSLYTLVYNASFNSGAGGFQINVQSLVTLKTQNANTLFAGPATGGAAIPTFRTIVTADLDSVAGQLPGATSNTDATVGNVGEYVTTPIAAASAVALTSGTAATIAAATLTAGDWDVWFAGVGQGGTATTLGYLTCSLATTGTISTLAGYYSNLIGANATVFNFGANPTNQVGPSRFSLAASTPVYALAQAAFGVSTMSVFGLLLARRVR